MIIEELAAKLDELNADALTIQAKADAEDREFTAEESEELDEIFERADQIKNQIEQREKIAAQALELSQGRGRKTQPQDLGETPRKDKVRIEAIERPEDRGRWGFRSFGEFAQCVKAAADPGGTRDARLGNIANAAVSTYSSEGSGADGGFAVPPDFRQAIVEKVMGEDSLISRTDMLTTSGNSITVPIDETTPWQTTGGVLAYWDGEGDAITQSKVALEQRNIRLNRLTALVPVTEELLEDAPALDAYLRRKTPEKMDFKINLGIVQGNGVGQPLGILNAPCTVSVAKESGQAADTIKFANIINMWSRLDRTCRANAVWLIHHDVEGELMKLEFVGTNATTPAYLPPGGLSVAPYGTIMGRPVIPTEGCETLGDKGDIFLADLSKYMTATKGGGISADMSIHLWFDQNITAFRFIFRVAGQPWWGASISPRDGSTTRSCFITLDERA